MCGGDCRQHQRRLLPSELRPASWAPATRTRRGEPQRDRQLRGRLGDGPRLRQRLGEVPGAGRPLRRVRRRPRGTDGSRELRPGAHLFPVPYRPRPQLRCQHCVSRTPRAVADGPRGLERGRLVGKDTRHGDPEDSARRRQQAPCEAARRPRSGRRTRARRGLRGPSRREAEAQSSETKRTEGALLRAGQLSLSMARDSWPRQGGDPKFLYWMRRLPMFGRRWAGSSTTQPPAEPPPARRTQRLGWNPGGFPTRRGRRDRLHPEDRLRAPPAAAWRL